ncbi:GTP-binding protein [Streptomyces sp. NPDC102278]|uniref:GTP-binding protein n=1 Tax=Streptomyces sp. NPDC102278 TaxID=3366152 RepID=UPI0038150CED
MEQKKSGRVVPQVTVVVLGNARLGKTTLAAAVSKVVHEKSPQAASLRSFADIANAPKQDYQGAQIAYAQVAYEAKGSRFTLIDCPSADDYRKLLVTGAVRPDGALLVVDAVDGVDEQAKQYLDLAHKAGIRPLVVVLNRAERLDQDGDEAILEFTAKQVGEVLHDYGFSTQDIPVVAASALKALEGDKDWSGRLQNLLDTIAETIPPAVEPDQFAFLLPIETAKAAPDTGFTVTGRVETGVVEKNGDVFVYGDRPQRIRARVAGIEIGGKPADTCRAGDSVTLLIHNVDESVIARGQCVGGYSWVEPVKKFTGSLYLYSAAEGGRTAPLPTGHQARFHIRTAEAAGTLTLATPATSVSPGQIAEVTVTLDREVLMDFNVPFTVHENGHTIAAGRIKTNPA